jgi:transcriptional regulator with XRE-family HTH domain
MKIKITKPDKPTELQKLIAELPFDAASEAEFKGLMFVEELLTLMKEQGINRTQLAERMGVGSPRVTAMLNGSSNFKLETLIRAGHAVGATLQQTLVPAGMKGRWVNYREDEIHSAFHASKGKVFVNPPFQLETDEIATEDDADAA